MNFSFLRSVPDAIRGLWVQGGFSPWAFCVAGDVFALNALLLGTRLIEVAAILVLSQLLVMWAVLKPTDRILVLNRRWVLVLAVALTLSGGVSRGLVELTAYTPLYRLQAAWELWTGLVSLTGAMMLPFAVRIENKPREPPDDEPATST